jgi:hypothetical protein
MYRKVFERNLNTECKIFLKIKIPLSINQWAKSSACLISEAGAAVLKGDSVGLCLFHGAVFPSNELWGQFSLSGDSLRPYRFARMKAREKSTPFMSARLLEFYLLLSSNS